MSDINADVELDVSGLFCPEPVMMLHNKIAEIEVGQTLKVLATDPSTQRDIPKFCTFLGQELLQQNADDKVFIYWIKKAQ
jgi:tRNA 2-thiouridine synthesizing protein A